MSDEVQAEWPDGTIFDGNDGNESWQGQDTTMSSEPDIVAALTRIAAALEEQNRVNLEHIAQQKKYHEETEALNEKRWQERVRLDHHVIDLNQHWHDEAVRLTAERYQAGVERDDHWRERHLEIVATQASRQNDQFQAAYEAYLDELRKEKKGRDEL